MYYCSVVLTMTTWQQIRKSGLPLFWKMQIWNLRKNYNKRLLFFFYFTLHPYLFLISINFNINNECLENVSCIEIHLWTLQQNISLSLEKWQFWIWIYHSQHITGARISFNLLIHSFLLYKRQYNKMG